MKRTFEDALIFGQIAENWFSGEAKKAGFLVERNCSEPVKDGRGPRATLPNGMSIPRPDFDVSKDGVCLKAEIKAKDDRTIGFYTKQEEAGIDYNRWEDYRFYQKATGHRILLVIPEYWIRGAEGEIVGQADKLLALPQVQIEVQKTGSTTYAHAPEHVLAQWIDELRPSPLKYPTFCHGKRMIYFSVWQFKSDWLALLEEEIADRLSVRRRP